jgi:hypothetical protein
MAAIAILAGSAVASSVPRLARESGEPINPPYSQVAATLDACLVVQAPDGTGNGLVSDTFTDFPTYTAFTFDDFTVPSGFAWDVSGFHADGMYDSGIVIPDSYTFEIYPDSAGHPACGTPVYTVTVAPGAPGLTDSVGVLDYSPGGTLTTILAGKYWASVSVTLDYDTRGQWFWASSSNPHTRGLAANFDNPGGAFAQPPCSKPTAFDFDMAFCVSGTQVPVGDETTCRVGNVNTGVGAPADVLLVNGSAGSPTFRVVNVIAGVAATVALIAPPAGGAGHYVLWTLDGAPTAGTLTEIRYKPGSGVVYDLGLGCKCLPINNTVVPASCPCPLTFPTGRTSRGLSAAKATPVCVNSKPGFPRYPTSFTQTFPAGTFTIGGVITDSGSPNLKPLSIMNWVIVVSS